MSDGRINANEINTPSTPRFNAPNAPNQNRAVSFTAGAQMIEASTVVSNTDAGDINGPGTESSSEEIETKEATTLTPRWKPLTADEVQLLIVKHKDVVSEGRVYDTPTILDTNGNPLKPRKLTTELDELTCKDTTLINPWFTRTRLIFLKSGTEEEFKVLHCVLACKGFAQTWVDTSPFAYGGGRFEVFEHCIKTRFVSQLLPFEYFIEAFNWQCFPGKSVSAYV
eukprot:Nk52_evm1s783 gene=Nk52_evmTU1s783